MRSGGTVYVYPARRRRHQCPWHGHSFRPICDLRPVHCDRVMDCVGAHAINALCYLPETHQLSICFSDDTGNLARLGTDACLFVAPPIGGDGLNYDPFTRVMSVRFSADTGNTARAGNDGGIYVPPPGAPGTQAILTANTPSVVLTGDGSSAAPLRAMTVPGQLGITTADSAEVDFSGTGAGASALSAGLTGIRNGDWRLVGGSVIIGDGASGVAQSFIVNRQLATGATFGAINLTGNGGGAVELGISDAAIAPRGVNLLVSRDAHLEVRDSADVRRPLPFACWTGDVTVSISNAANGFANITYPAGRFTETPFVFVTPVASAVMNVWACSVGGRSPTGVTIHVRHIENAISTSSVDVQVWAVQMPF